MVKYGCGQSGNQDSKIGLSQEWIDGMNWWNELILCMQVQILES